jgi:hypothetical protein
MHIVDGATRTGLSGVRYASSGDSGVSTGRRTWVGVPVGSSTLTVALERIVRPCVLWCGTEPGAGSCGAKACPTGPLVVEVYGVGAQSWRCGSRRCNLGLAAQLPAGEPTLRAVAALTWCPIS